MKLKKDKQKTLMKFIRYNLRLQKKLIKLYNDLRLPKQS